jgi:PAS domain S-box-containing protein
MHNSPFDIFDNLILSVNLDGEIIDINDAFLRLLVLSREEVLGKKEKDILAIEYSSKEKEDIASLLKGDVPLVYDETLMLNDDLYYYKTKKELIFDKYTKSKKIVITRRDITSSKQYFNLYNDHKILLEYIAKGEPIKFILNKIIKSVELRNKNIMCSILLLDETKEKLIKGAAPSLPDYYNDKLNGMTIGEKVGSCGAAVYLKKRVVVDDISTHENWKYAKRLAAEINVHACWSQPFFSSTNEVLGSFAIYYNKPKKPSIFDIHLIEDIASITGIAVEKHNYQIKQKKDEKKKQEQEELLMHKAKQAMMGEMLENIAHQWRQPLSVISTCATGILMNKEHGIDTSELEEEAFEIINLNAQYLSNTIDDFRKYFMSKGKKVEFEVENCVEHTLKLVETRLKAERINIVNNIDKIKILSYENELTQVFMNIFNNSIDALSKVDKKERFIFLEVKKDDNDIIIKIIDSGNGVEKSILQRIFEPYFTTKHQKNGTGIGLYMCKDIIEKHIKGSIIATNNSYTYKNKTYQGLEFIIHMPIETE